MQRLARPLAVSVLSDTLWHDMPSRSHEVLDRISSVDQHNCRKRLRETERKIERDRERKRDKHKQRERLSPR
uniref:Uncharacterized protein n=1 Tax=Hucho hucho TaxID=62062 RepID=A0A4W5Q5M1_9TELE